MISDPLCPPDCNVPAIGCRAMVLSTAERARILRRKPAIVAAAGPLHDGFAPSTLDWLEVVGFCGRGEALDCIHHGRIPIGCKMPINTFGWGLTQGRLRGMDHVAEAVLQLTDRAGPRHIDGAHSIDGFDGSPMLRDSALVLTRDP